MGWDLGSFMVDDGLTTRVRGSEAARKPVHPPKAWTAPHPLQPIVRPAFRASQALLFGFLLLLQYFR
jgi:hypothetical protein